ncbi:MULTISPECIES: GNAT family protein [unclassified Paenibacillus]|uniref:GNAT family N-acetyltransferase n=1 Tax=unclassified Paenibacillus TaxID=185978 RepID=UPI00104FF760|nr:MULTISPECIES: GNAT family protein [unclassified Paenibacillus]NIK71592.1 ribosomal-protein-alanine N-acetyltransferase [Paenibacillus sp. BK720]TCM96241.1 ribosomal-protein-alanine N-acetyltransferase [Paenibacillus sp. BK033]
MSTNGIYLRLLELGDAKPMLELKLRNRAFSQPFEPIRGEGHYTLEEQVKEISNGISAAQREQAYFYGVFLREGDELIGRIALTSVSRGVFQNAYMGYFIDQAHNGRGYATSAVSEAVSKAFAELQLHRIQAGVMPKNERSIRVLQKAGFRQEGLAQRYLKINGQWEDHLLFAITKEDLT